MNIGYTNMQYSAGFVGPASIPLKQNKTNGILTAQMAMPAKFYGADGGNTFSMGRKAFIASKANMGKVLTAESSSSRIERLKRNAIGAGSTKVGLIKTAPLSFKHNSQHDIVVARNRVRRAGGAVPPKCTAY